MFIFLTSCGSSTNSNNIPTPTKNFPNIVLILTDDMRWDLMSVMDHPYIQTPTLDRLANNGVLFENAFIPVAVCSPSRAALLSGREAHQASAPGIYWRNNSFLETQITFPQLLHEKGYKTGYFGKWHLGDGKTPKPGFDQWESFDWLGDFRNITLWINGEKRKFTGFSDDIIASRTVNFIKQQAGSDKPFFTMVGFKEPHLPFKYPKRYETVFNNVTIPKPDSFNEDFSVSGKESIPWLKIDTTSYGIPLFGSWDNYIKSHYRGILGLDSAVSKIIASLEEIGELDNTLFIYTSDNGYSLGEHGLTEKHLTYEEPIRVPMLVHYPDKIKAGLRRTEMVTNIDIAPTILDYAGIDIPDYMSGKSWRILMEAKSDVDIPEWRNQLFFWLLNAQATIRTERYKYIMSIRTPGHFELYDLLVDPKETNNVYNQKDYQVVQADMQQRFNEETKKIAWSKRESQFLSRVYISNVLDTVKATALISNLSRENLEPTMTLPTLLGELFWRKARAKNNKFKLADIADISGVDSQKSVLLAIPIERLSDWDPFTILRFKPKPKAYLYSRGKKIWYSYSENPIDHANPPLHTKLDYAYVLINLETDILSTSVSLEVAEGMIRLPLQD